MKQHVILFAYFHSRKCCQARLVRIFAVKLAIYRHLNALSVETDCNLEDSLECEGKTAISFSFVLVESSSYPHGKGKERRVESGKGERWKINFFQLNTNFFFFSTVFLQSTQLN